MKNIFDLYEEIQIKQEQYRSEQWLSFRIKLLNMSPVQRAKAIKKVVNYINTNSTAFAVPDSDDDSLINIDLGTMVDCETAIEKELDFIDWLEGINWFDAYQVISGVME